MRLPSPSIRQFVAAAIVVGAASVFSSPLVAIGEDKPPAAPEAKLPPGWTAEDMQAYMVAATPGKMHALLQQSVGEWTGKCQTWMAGVEQPMESQCMATTTPLMDGKFVKWEMKGDMPGMGPYHGYGLYGYDNVAQKFQCTWLDNLGTGMMVGTGDLSPDGKTLTWNFAFHCPITKKQMVMREIETYTDSKTKTIEMFGPDPKTGREFKMMRLELTKK